MSRLVHAVLAASFLFVFLAAAASGSEAALDPQRVVGADRCGECHMSEYDVWKASAHARGFYELARTDPAQAIAGALGIHRIKTASACTSCHFTESIGEDAAAAAAPGEDKPQAGGARAVSGVSCESCHGEAREWMPIHYDFGGPDLNARTEKPEHRVERLRRSSEAGLNLPSQTTRLARRCFACHMVPDETLVNAGGHPTGGDFELVAWMQGEIRHNYLRSGNDTNQEASPERRRQLYVVGRALELEAGLEGISRSRQDGAYLDAARARISAARGTLQAIHDVAPLPPIAAMLEATAKLADRSAAEIAAQRVRALVEDLLTVPAASLEAVTPLLPAADRYRGQPLP